MQEFTQKFHAVDDRVQFDPIAREQDIFNCFRLILGRYPSRAEWAGHLRQAGSLLRNVVSGYVDSVEYQNLRSKREPEFACLPGGLGLYASPEDFDIGAGILSGQEYEAHVSQIFMRRLSPGMTVLDIGANIGYFTFRAAERVGPSGRVCAIEPNPKNVSFLLATRARNGFENVEIIQAAASDRWEVLCLAMGGNTSNGTALHPRGVTPSDFSTPVMALPLSACLSSSRRIDVIKIDVEGAEGKALGGMLDLIDRDRPVVFSEFTPSTLPVVSRISPGEYLDLFTRRGYQLAVLEPSGPRRLSAEELLEHAAAVAAQDHVDILAEPALPATP